MSEFTPDGFRFKHQWALRDLRRYCDDDSIDFERLNPFLSAVDEGHLDSIRAKAESLVPYLACSVFIDNLYCELAGIKANV